MNALNILFVGNLLLCVVNMFLAVRFTELVNRAKDILFLAYEWLEELEELSKSSEGGQEE